MGRATRGKEWQVVHFVEAASGTTRLSDKRCGHAAVAMGRLDSVVEVVGDTVGDTVGEHRW